MTRLENLILYRECLMDEAAGCRHFRDLRGEKEVLTELRNVTHDILALENAIAGRRGKVLVLIGPGVTVL